MSILNTEPAGPWQLTPELQAALDAANERLAQEAQARAPAPATLQPPPGARDLVEWGKFKLKPAGASLLRPELSAREFFETLVTQDALADARRVLAHALPKRRALWWAVLTSWDACRPAPTDELGGVLQAVTNFVAMPTEDRRRACGAWINRVPAHLLAASLATAAFFSAGSVSPPGLPPVAPRPFVTGRLVGVCVYLCSVKRSPAQYKQYLREYLNWGRELAQGRLPLPSVESSPQALPEQPMSRLADYWNLVSRETADSGGLS